MATFRCDCGAWMTVDDEFAGRAVDCPTCGKSIVVPRQGATPAAGKTARRIGPGNGPLVLVCLLALVAAGLLLWGGGELLASLDAREPVAKAVAGVQRTVGAARCVAGLVMIGLAAAIWYLAEIASSLRAGQKT